MILGPSPPPPRITWVPCTTCAPAPPVPQHHLCPSTTWAPAPPGYSTPPGYTSHPHIIHHGKKAYNELSLQDYPRTRKRAALQENYPHLDIPTQSIFTASQIFRRNGDVPIAVIRHELTLSGFVQHLGNDPRMIKQLKFLGSRALPQSILPHQYPVKGELGETHIEMDDEMEFVKMVLIKQLRERWSLDPPSDRRTSQTGR
nr:uncharacterized protein LOC128686647 [Cherax quadricarinatus]